MLMNLKKYTLLLTLVACAMTACNKNNTDSSVSKQEIAQIKTNGNSAPLSVHDVDNHQVVVFNTTGNYRTLNAEKIKQYNQQYQSVKTIKYFYTDEQDVHIIVTKVSPVSKTKEVYFADLESAIKKIFPKAEYRQVHNSNPQFDYADYAYVDQNNKLNNACHVMLTNDNTTVYSICSISPTQSIDFLKKSVYNILTKVAE